MTKYEEVNDDGSRGEKKKMTAVVKASGEWRKASY